MMEKELHIEKDFWDDFIVEAFEHIDSIETNAMALEQNPEDMEIIHTMFRAFHTIKGLSGFVEHTIIQELAHKTETLMDFCRKGELAVSTKIVDAILKTSDYIKRMCEDMDAYKDEDLLVKIEEHIVVLQELANVDSVAQPQPAPVQAYVEEVVENVVVEEVSVQEVSEQIESTPQEEVLEVNEVQEQQEFAQSQEAPVQQVDDESVTDEILPLGEEGLNALASIPLVLEDQEGEPVAEQENVEIPQPELVQACVSGSSEIQEQSSFPQNQESEEVKPEDLVLKSFQMEIMQKLQGAANTKNEKAEHSKENSNGGRTLSANEEYMKVANYKIDHLVDMISELIISQSLIEQYVFVKYSEDRQLVSNMSGFLRITRELQNLSMSLRMVSLKSTFQKISRIARDTIQELGKEVEVVISGENTEIDRAVTEKLLDPLVHLIKNAISHGVEENVEDRIAKGKNRKARVELNAYNKRGKIFIEIKDDGRGINTEIVYQKALEKGLIDLNRNYSDAEIKEFIMLPGFSTAKVVDNISGRGVGMDVVKTQILKIGGKVDIQSTLNEGSTFTLEVPVNHAIMNGTVIEINKQHFVVPTVNVKEFMQPSEGQWIFTKSERTMIKVRDNIIPIVPTSIFFEGTKDEVNVPLVMILELDQELRAVPITNVINRQEVVVKPVTEEFSHLKYISGMSILGTGRVSLILDIDYLFRKEVKE